MFNKKVLGAAVAAAVVSSGANAIDFDAASPAGSIWASDALITTGSQTVSGVTYYVITDGANSDLTSLSEVSLGLAADTPIYIRYDVTNAVFNTPVTAAELTVTDSGAGAVETLSQGGTVGTNSVVFGATPAAAAKFDIDDTATLAPADLAVSAAGPVGMTVSYYLSVTDAINQANSFKSVTVSSYASFASGLALTVTGTDQVAEVEDSFLSFVSGTDTAEQTVGTSSAAAAATTVDNVGVTTLLAKVATDTTSVVTVTGNFSAGTWALNAQADCDGAGGVITVAADDLTATAMLDVFNTTPYLCNTVDGVTAIPGSGYSVGVAYTAVANAAMPVAAGSGSLGTISRNGTTVQIPYLTTFSDYNQRLIMVNRGISNVNYTISFTTEAGTTAVAGSAATGTLAAGASTMVKASDIVTLTGKTRTSATLTVVSPTANIDVATTQVNLSDGGTDTVKLK